MIIVYDENNFAGETFKALAKIRITNVYQHFWPYYLDPTTKYKYPQSTSIVSNPALVELIAKKGWRMLFDR